MEGIPSSILNAGALRASIERLDRAVTTLEGRIIGLKERAEHGGQPLPEDYQALIAEIEQIKRREKDLETVAVTAMTAMGKAADAIRLILATDNEV